jgi:hypothetical protein
LLENNNLPNKHKPTACNSDMCLNPNRTGISQFQRNNINGLTKTAESRYNGMLIKRKNLIKETYHRQSENPDGLKG